MSQTGNPVYNVSDVKRNEYHATSLKPIQHTGMYL